MKTSPENFLHDLLDEARARTLPLYVVGGTLRDRALNLPIQDLDFCTPEPRVLAEWSARKAGTRVVTLDATPGRETFRVPLAKHRFCDFSALQGTDILEDLSRRDFTINAMAQPLEAYLKKTGEDLLDPFSGKQDLERKLIRALPGNPFRDDPVRLLRAFRFSAQLDFRIEEETFRSLIQNKDLVLKPAAERISHELLLFLGSPCPDLPALVESGLARTLVEPDLATAGFPGKQILMRWHRRNFWKENAGEPLFENREAIQRYLSESGHGALFSLSLWFGPQMPGHPGGGSGPEENGEFLSEKFMRRYKFSNRQRTFVGRALRGANQFVRELAADPDRDWSEQQIYRWVRPCGEEFLCALLLAGTLPPPDKVKKELWKLRLESLYDFYFSRFLPALKQPALLTGRDLAGIFHLKPSQLYREILERVKEAQVTGRIQTRDQAEALVREWLQTSQ